ncbi:pyrimidine dimer DNA glycosylase/endonuclease V [Diaphorobacter sp.]|uniref:pyrimidine dimer DNA glycosylase/endonuclease V n=1 Tax=Diaphorobacter sp. TaxID=1934310 RepID=UPI0028AA5159|nr:pyrimidine dimer DNA glycosylase/endonuclease V [Diaphorobacter sp.]
MRLWSLHPRHLDTKGLVALWREGLLAQAVLHEQTKGYRNHPQLERFRALASPQNAIALYLRSVQQEADTRGYRFDASKIQPVKNTDVMLSVTNGQLEYEWEHLLRKLEQRSPENYAQAQRVERPQLHPMFTLTTGPIADWERPLGR